jgi:hypothetical protein
MWVEALRRADSSPKDTYDAAEDSEFRKCIQVRLCFVVLCRYRPYDGPIPV